MSAATRFSALGTYVHVGVRRPHDLDTATRLAETVLRDVDETCSRFRTDSDLTRVNTHPGEWVAVDPLLVAAVDVACTAAGQTAGLVHPLLGRPLVELGYDRDFALLAEVETTVLPSPAAPAPALDAWQRIELDPAGAVRIPDGTALDLGAIGKAWAADLIAAAFESELGRGAIVSVGGDVRIAGDGDRWDIAVSEHPDAPAEAVVGLDGGGLATSSTQVRRWTRHGVRRHHLFDPRTGRPADGAWRTVTATGPTCVAANTASTAVVLLGRAAPAWLAERAVAARLVGRDGRIVRVGAWPEDDSITCPTPGSAA